MQCKQQNQREKQYPNQMSKAGGESGVTAAQNSVLLEPRHVLRREH
jgi:hypothetical protein